jgi:hypothetical protein
VSGSPSTGSRGIDAERLLRPAVAVPALVLVGLVAAVTGVFRFAPTLDEAYVYGLSQHGFWPMLEFWADDPQALLPQIVAYPFAVVADPVWWLRLPAFAAFLATIPLLWWTARQRYSQTVALGAAALLAISPLAILYASDARWPPYALLAGTASWGVLFRAIDTGSRRWWIGYALVVAAAVYTNATLVLVIAAQVVPVLWERRRALVPWVLSLAGAAVLVIPLAVQTLRADDVNPLFRVPTPSPADVPGFLAQLTGGGGPERVRQALLLVAIALVLVAAWSMRRRLFTVDARGGWLAVAWIGIPVAAAFVISQGSSSIWLSRYLIATVPGICLLIAWSASRVPRPAAVAFIAAIAVLMVVGIVEQSQGRGEPTDDWTEAIVAARPPGAPVVFFEAEGAQAAGYHEPSLGAADGTPIIPSWDETPPPPDIVLLDTPEFDRLPKGPPSAALVEHLATASSPGVVVLALRPSDPEAPGIAWAREHCTVDRQDFDDSPTAVFRVSACNVAQTRPGG